MVEIRVYRVIKLVKDISLVVVLHIKIVWDSVAPFGSILGVTMIDMELDLHHHLELR